MYFDGAKDLLELRRMYATYCRKYSYDVELYKKITEQYREALKNLTIVRFVSGFKKQSFVQIHKKENFSRSTSADRLFLPRPFKLADFYQMK